MITPPQNTETVAQQAAQRAAVAFFGKARTNVAKIDVVEPGCSGGLVFRMRESGGDAYAIKRWPQGTTATRVEEVHRFMRLARDRGCDFVPHVQSLKDPMQTCWVTAKDGCWDACQWMPGKTVSQQQGGTSVEAVVLQDLFSAARSGARAIARFHQAFADQQIRSAPTSAIEQRINRIHELGRQLPRVLRHDCPHELLDLTASERACIQDVFQRSCDWLKSHWSSMTERALIKLNRWKEIPTLQQVVLRDIHLDHMLFHWPTNRPDNSSSDGAIIDSITDKPIRRNNGPATGHRVEPNHPIESSSEMTPMEPEVSGLLDYDAIQWDCPATDLARWASSFTLPPMFQASLDATSPDGLKSRFEVQIWESVLAGYREIRTFSEREADLAKTLADTGVWISLANWLTWLALEKRRFPGGAEAIRTRMSKLMSRLSLQIP